MYSIVIPYLSNSNCIDLCLKYIEQNSMYKHEIVSIVDEKDVYYAFNKGVFLSKYDIVVLMNDDMIVSKNWDKFIPVYSNQSTILTGYVVEPMPDPEENVILGPNCINHQCGSSPANFDYDKFQRYVDNHQFIDDVQMNKKGWYMPLVVNKKSFVTYPNINKFPEYANDVILIDHIMPFLGFRFAQINMWAYHFSRQATLDSNATIKKCIFTYCNHQIDQKIPTLQQNVIEKFNNVQNCKYEILKYNRNDGEIFLDQVIDYGVNKLFYEDRYDVILMFDIDCIPLNSDVLQYMFDKAMKGFIIGNIQRSNHIDNGEHVYVAPSAICISKDIYEMLGRPSFGPTKRSDIGEELCYIAEEKNIPLETFLPKHSQEFPLNEKGQPQDLWNLKENMPKYGIGTTFVNLENKEMTYHLFQSRVHKFNQLFFDKCINVLTSDGV